MVRRIIFFFFRDSPGKTIKTHTYSSSTSSPSKTTITKTVVTETEERYEKKEVISISGNKKFLQDFDAGKVEEQLKKVETAFNPKITPPVKSSTSYSKNILTPSGSTTLPEDTDYFSARKARLANLANKFKAMDEESPIRSPVHSFSSEKRSENMESRSPSRTIPVCSDEDSTPISQLRPVPSRSCSPSKIVTNATAKPYTSPTKSSAASPVKVPSPFKSATSKFDKPDDESFISSLKAQGFTETESASRLVYDFQPRNRSPSPTKSPVRQFTTRQDKSVMESEIPRNVDETRARLEKTRGRTEESRGRPSVKPTVLSSPTRTAVSASRSISPSKPHPLQFISPQVAAQAAAAAPPAPPKPSRTFDTNPAPVNKSWITKAKVDDKVSDAKSDDRCDTPVRKTMSEKRHMFENRTPEVEPVDPAMMSMSDRKKLFEKNRSIPTPIARFGESVTPAMLSKAKPIADTMTPAEAWKRKRELSPVKHQPPAKKVSPENNAHSAAKPRLAQEHRRLNSEPSPATPQAGRKVKTFISCELLVSLILVIYLRTNWLVVFLLVFIFKTWHLFRLQRSTRSCLRRRTGERMISRGRFRRIRRRR